MNREESASIAILLLMISVGMLFATLLASYAILRNNSTNWGMAWGIELPLLYPTMSTVFIGLSSVFFELFKSKCDKKWYFLSLVMGLSFALSQLQLWQSLVSMGITVDTGVYASTLFGFTWIHAAHVLLGLFSLFYLGMYSLSWKEEEVPLRIINVGKFWHFLGVIWFILYGVLFLL